MHWFHFENESSSFPWTQRLSLIISPNVFLLRFCDVWSPSLHCTSHIAPFPFSFGTLLSVLNLPFPALNEKIDQVLTRQPNA